MPPAGPDPSKSADPTRCVVWHSEGAALPYHLTRAFERRRIVVTRCSDPFSALANLCILIREARKADVRADETAAWAGRFILVIVPPASFADAASLVSAAERYVPSVVPWLFESGKGGANPRLRRIVKEDIDSWSRRGRPPLVTPSARPALRLADTGEFAAATVGRSSQPAGASPDLTPAPGKSIFARSPSSTPDPEPRKPMHPILTNDEIAMLLSGDAPDAKSTDSKRPPGKDSDDEDDNS